MKIKVSLSYAFYDQLCFWPADEIDAAFARVNAALGKPDELEELRLFVRVMNYWYGQADHVRDCDLAQEDIDEVCRLAKKALNLELGITDPRQ